MSISWEHKNKFIPGFTVKYNVHMLVHYEMLPYERLMVDGKYPDGATEAKAKELTARHVLSHTTGLSNVGLNASSPLSFHPDSELGKTYSYSGEAFFYLQKVIESQTGEKLEELAQKHVFGPKALDMKRSTYPGWFFNMQDICSGRSKIGTNIRE